MSFRYFQFSLYTSETEIDSGMKAGGLVWVGMKDERAPFCVNEALISTSLNNEFIN